ncbi:ATP-binding cassette domain-containing protein [bacterium]|nr:ATP-binding cassette domain-containing protein [bacterium]
MGGFMGLFSKVKSKKHQKPSEEQVAKKEKRKDERQARERFHELVANDPDELPVLHREDIINKRGVFSKLNDAALLKIQSKFGMLFQSAALFDSLNVYENVTFGLRRLTKMSEAVIKRRADEVLKMVSMPGTELLAVSSLSGGMKKRVALARALATSPKYLLYDEPTTGLDPILAESINKLVRKLNKETRITSVVVTHDMHSAFMVSDRIAFLLDGVIKEIGTGDEIKNTKLKSLRNFINAGDNGDGIDGETI